MAFLFEDDDSSARADVAVGEVVTALRYARAESVRRGGPPYTLGLTIDNATGVVSLNYYFLQVVGINLKAIITSTPVVINPIDKKKYSIDLHNLPFANGAKLGAVSFGGTAQANPVQVIFDPRGTSSNAEGPSYQIYPKPSWQLPIIIPVTYGKATRKIQIDGLGRVIIL